MWVYNSSENEFSLGSFYFRENNQSMKTIHKLDNNNNYNYNQALGEIYIEKREYILPRLEV